MGVVRDSFPIPEWVFDNRELTRKEKLVLVALFYFFANSSSPPSIREISKLLGIHKCTVINAVKSLEKKGIVGVLREKGKVNRYVIQPPRA